MLRLAPQTESVWIELPGEVRIKMRPIRTVEFQAMRNRVVKVIAKMQADEEDAAKAGFPPDPDGRTMANPEYRSALGTQLTAQELLAVAGEEWEGVGDQDGNPVPLTKEWIERFAAINFYAQRFLEAADNNLAAQISTEGNGSAPSSPGVSGEGANTAMDAAPAAADAAPSS